jgi:hypothetical protein
MPEALKAHLQTRLFVLVVLAFLPALALFVYSSRQTTALRSQIVDEQLARSADVARVEYLRLLDEGESLLGVLSQVPAIRDVERSECDAILGNALRLTPQYTTLSRIGLDGYLSCGSLTPEKGLYLGDRTYFTLAMTLRQFAVGNYALGRITGRPGVGVALPVIVDGETQGVIAASIDLSRLAKNALSAELADGMSFTVVDRNGQVLVREPSRPDPAIADSIGTQTGDGFPGMPEGRGVQLVDGIDLDGFPRRFAVSNLSRGTGRDRGYVVIGADRDALVDEIASIAATGRSFLLLAAIGLLILAWVWGHYFLVRRAVEEKRAAIGNT